MAQLLSEDEEIKTSIELVVLKEKNLKEKKSPSWLPYELVLTSGQQRLIFKKDHNNGTGDYVFAATPINELKIMIEGIESFLKNDDKKLFSFEPAEPSFELIIERTHKGYSVTVWADSGNVISDHYSWDSFGVRFFTNEKNIKLFIEELKNTLCPQEKT